MCGYIARMQQSLRQALSVRGDLEVRVIEAATGELVRRLEVRNMIMTSGMSLIGQLLAGYDTASDRRRLGWLFVGTGATAVAVNNNIASITAPGGSTVACPLTVTTSVSGSQTTVVCTAMLETTQANTHTITEAGLISVGELGAPSVGVGAYTLGAPALFARQMFAGVPKTSALTILFDWRITFTA